MRLKINFELAHKEVYEWAYVTLASMAGVVIFCIITFYLLFGYTFP